MGVLSFIGHFLLGSGPCVAFFVVFIASKPLAVLLTFASAFIWLFVLLCISALFRGFIPLDDTVNAYSASIISAVVLQEAARYGTWIMHRKLVDALAAHATDARLRFGIVDRLYLALAWGFGHGAIHSALLFVSLLPLTLGDGTYYYARCGTYSIFLAGALNSLSFWAILTCISILYFDGLQSKSPSQVAGASLMHVAAAALTILSFQKDGCSISIPLLLCFAAVSMLVTAMVCWRHIQRAARQTES